MVLELLAGGGLVALGWLAGRFAPSRPRLPKPPKPICGCDHELAFHDPATGECHGTNGVDRYNPRGTWVGEEQVRCTCRQYDGPTPLPIVYAREIAP